MNLSVFCFVHSVARLLSCFSCSPFFPHRPFQEERKENTDPTLLRTNQRKRPAPDSTEGRPTKSRKTELDSSATDSSSTTTDLPPLDVSTLDGYELLSTEERKLCSELRLIPAHYFVIKERLLREGFTRGLLKPQQARQLFRIGQSLFIPCLFLSVSYFVSCFIVRSVDVSKTNKIMDFFVSVGWVTVQPDV